MLMIIPTVRPLLLPWDWVISSLGLFFSSISLGATGLSAQGDAIWGATWIGEDYVPLNFLAYFTYQANFGAGNGIINLNASAAAAFIGSAYIAIEERTPSNTIAQVQFLENNLNGFSWSLYGTQSPSIQNPQISYVTFIGQSLSSPSWSITITNVLSNVVGVLSYANAIVSPKSVETIIQINNWPYQSSSNNLVLILGLVTASGTASGNAYLYGSGTTSVYFSVGASAVVNGVVSPVGFSGYSSAEYSGYVAYIQNTTIFAQAQAKFQGSATVQLAQVSFPANASQITYDPDVGSGSQINGTVSGTTGGSSSGTTAAVTTSGADGVSVAAFMAFISIVISLINLFM